KQPICGCVGRRQPAYLNINVHATSFREPCAAAVDPPAHRGYLYSNRSWQIYVLNTGQCAARIGCCVIVLREPEAVSSRLPIAVTNRPQSDRYRSGKLSSSGAHMRRLFSSLTILTVVAGAPALAQQQPPARVGRVSFVAGN